MNFSVTPHYAHGENGPVDLLQGLIGNVGSMQCTFLKILLTVIVSIIIFSKIQFLNYQYTLQLINNQLLSFQIYLGCNGTQVPDIDNHGACIDCSDISKILNADGDACLDDCNANGETKDSDSNGRCDISCIASGMILNAAGTDCLNDCNANGETIDSNGNGQCNTSCPASEILNAAGTECLKDCNKGGETIDSDSNGKCDTNCGDTGMLLLNADGTDCLNDCNANGETIDSDKNGQCDKRCAEGLKARDDDCIPSKYMAKSK